MNAANKPPSLRVYGTLARLPWPKSFIGKLFAISFVGVHIPLIAFALYALSALPLSDPIVLRLAVLLVCATLLGAAVTFWLINGLVAPLKYLAAALDDYRATSAKPSLPKHYRDQLGLLLSSVQTTVEDLDASLHSMRQRAETDVLTGVGNRRWLIEHGENALRKARESGRPICVTMIDLDGFKRLNDANGHLIGDQALWKAASIAREVFSGGSYLARWGGDEFCVVSPGLDAAEAFALVERFRLRLEKTDVTGRGLGFLTASAGISPCVVGDATILRCIERADDLLYRAKASGKNRSALANGSAP